MSKSSDCENRSTGHHADERSIIVNARIISTPNKLLGIN
jgi:hypothetical protein